MSKYHEPFALRSATITPPFQRFGFRDLFFSKHRLSSFSFNGTVESRVPEDFVEHEEIDECHQTIVAAISNHTLVQLQRFFYKQSSCYIKFDVSKEMLSCSELLEYSII